MHGVTVNFWCCRYIYAGKIENLNTRSPRLLEAADKYQLSELKEICEEMLCSSLTVETCLECLVLADMHNAADLKVGGGGVIRGVGEKVALC